MLTSDPALPAKIHNKFVFYSVSLPKLLKNLVEDLLQKYFHYLMMSLAVFDCLYIVTALIIFSAPHLIPRYNSSKIIQKEEIQLPQTFYVLYNSNRSQSYNTLSVKGLSSVTDTPIH